MGSADSSAHQQRKRLAAHVGPKCHSGCRRFGSEGDEVDSSDHREKREQVAEVGERVEIVTDCGGDQGQDRDRSVAALFAAVSSMTLHQRRLTST